MVDIAWRCCLLNTLNLLLVSVYYLFFVWYSKLGLLYVVQGIPLSLCGPTLYEGFRSKVIRYVEVPYAEVQLVAYAWLLMGLVVFGIDNSVRPPSIEMDQSMRLRHYEKKKKKVYIQRMATR